MHSYEIRVSDYRGHISLLLFAQSFNDMDAIDTARFVTRREQAVEVWREDRLIYRIGPRSGCVSQSIRPKRERERSRVFSFWKMRKRR